MRFAVERRRFAVTACTLAAFAGCAKPDLAVSSVAVRGCEGRVIANTIVILNRDYGGNLFVYPGSVGETIGIQTWLSSETTLQNDVGERTAGGWSLDPARDFGPDRLLTPGESVSLAVEGNAGPTKNPVDPSRTPYFIVKVDPRNIFDPATTTDGRVDEADEANNVAFVAIGTCN